MMNLANGSYEEITGTTDATPGTRSNHPISGFTVAPTRGQVDLFPSVANDDDVNNAGVVIFVKATTTQLTVKGTVPSIPFTARIWKKKIDPETIPTSTTSLGLP